MQENVFKLQNVNLTADSPFKNKAIVVNPRVDIGSKRNSVTSTKKVIPLSDDLGCILKNVAPFKIG